MQPAVYLLASKRYGTLYVGVTSNLVGRTWQHRSDEVDGFSKKYGVHMLVWFELHETMLEAITREKQIKKWNRAWKMLLIEQRNPEWSDLYLDLNNWYSPDLRQVGGARPIPAHNDTAPETCPRKNSCLPRRLARIWLDAAFRTHRPAG